MNKVGERMTVNFPEDLTRNTGLSERELLVEFACWLFDRERLELWPAAQLAGLSRGEFEVELLKRRIPAYRPTIDDLDNDLKTMRAMDGTSKPQDGAAA